MIREIVGFFSGTSRSHFGDNPKMTDRHSPAQATNDAALSSLIDTAYSDIKARVENG